MPDSIGNPDPEPMTVLKALVQRLPYKKQAQTRAVTAASKVIEAAKRTPGPGSIDALNRAKDNLETSWRSLRDHGDDIVDNSVDVAQINEIGLSLDKRQEFVLKCHNDIDICILEVQRSLLSAEVNTAETRTALLRTEAAGIPTVAPAQHLEPQRLSRQATPVELREWMAAFKLYYDSSAYINTPLPNQQGNFKRLLDNELLNELATLITPSLPIYGDNSCISTLKDNFRKRYPLFLRRNDLFRRAQRPGENPIVYVTDMNTLAELAMNDQMSSQDTLIHLIIANCSDRRLKDK